MGKKLIQITDIHLLDTADAAYKGHNVYQSCNRVLQQIAKQHADADLFLLTGDLSQNGSQASYRLLQQLLLPLGIPAIALPGNHDNQQNMRAIFDPAIISCNKVQQLADWQILLLDSTISNQVGGCLAAAELAWLEAQLQNSAESPVLVSLHHPPVAVGSDWMDAIGLENGEQLLARLTQYAQVKLVLFGHAHQVVYRKQAQLELFGTPSTCWQFQPGAKQFRRDILPPAFRVIRLAANGSFTTEVVFVN